jgi:hypothetical protein
MPRLPRSCSRGDGTPKKAYLSHAEAKIVAGDKLVAYPCPICLSWHVGHVQGTTPQARRKRKMVQRARSYR